MVTKSEAIERIQEAASSGKIPEHTAKSYIERIEKGWSSPEYIIRKLQRKIRKEITERPQQTIQRMREKQAEKQAREFVEKHPDFRIVEDKTTKKFVGSKEYKVKQLAKELLEKEKVTVKYPSASQKMVKFSQGKAQSKTVEVQISKPKDLSYVNLKRLAWEQSGKTQQKKKQTKVQKKSPLIEFVEKQSPLAKIAFESGKTPEAQRKQIRERALQKVSELSLAPAPTFSHLSSQGKAPYIKEVKPEEKIKAKEPKLGETYLAPATEEQRASLRMQQKYSEFFKPVPGPAGVVQKAWQPVVSFFKTPEAKRELKIEEKQQILESLGKPSAKLEPVGLPEEGKAVKLELTPSKKYTKQEKKAKEKIEKEIRALQVQKLPQEWGMVALEGAAVGGAFGLTGGLSGIAIGAASAAAGSLAGTAASDVTYVETESPELALAAGLGTGIATAVGSAKLLSSRLLKPTEFEVAAKYKALELGRKKEEALYAVVAKKGEAKVKLPLEEKKFAITGKNTRFFAKVSRYSKTKPVSFSEYKTVSELQKMSRLPKGKVSTTKLLGKVLGKRTKSITAQKSLEVTKTPKGIVEVGESYGRIISKEIIKRRFRTPKTVFHAGKGFSRFVAKIKEPEEILFPKGKVTVQKIGVVAKGWVEKFKGVTKAVPAKLEYRAPMKSVSFLDILTKARKKATSFEKAGKLFTISKTSSKLATSIATAQKQLAWKAAGEFLSRVGKISSLAGVGGTAVTVAKTARKTQVRTKPLAKISIASIPKTKGKAVPLSIIKPIEKKIIKPSVKTAFKSATLTKQAKALETKTQVKTRTLTKTLTKEMEITKPKLAQIETAITSETTEEKTITVPKITHAEISATTQLQKAKTATFVKPIPVPIVAPQPSIKGWLWPKRKSAKLPPIARKKEFGYHVYAKEKSKFVKVSKKPLPKQDALRLGATVVDETVSATFKIKKARKKVEKPLISFRPFNLFKFRQKKGTKNVFVEKNTFRIDSLGELKGITVKGWLARKKKSLRWF